MRTLLLSLLLAAFGSVPAAQAATLLHHYSFDGAAVIDSVGIADGSFSGAAWNTNGWLHLEGGFVQFTQKLIPTSGGFSVVLLARELSPSPYDIAEMISQGQSYGPGFYIGYYGSARPMRLGDQWQSTGVAFPSDGLVHHYAFTTDSSGARLYIDGLLVTNHGPISVSASGENTRLGCQFGMYGEFFRGELDGLRIYSGALTAEEVKALAVAAQPPRLSIEPVRAVRVAWPSNLAGTYQVQFTSDLASGQWQTVGQPVQGNAANYILDVAESACRYYRAVPMP